MKDIAHRAAEDLRRKHNPDFIILYGSVSRGDFNEHSDIDIACFSQSITMSKDIRNFEGRKLDCWLYKLDDAIAQNKAFLRMVDGQVLFDKHGKGRQFLKDVRKFYDSGPEPLKLDSRNHLVKWAEHMLLRINDGSIESNYRKNLLPCELLEMYFVLRNEWFMGSKQSFKWLEKNDNTTYALFEKVLSDQSDTKSLAKLVAATTETKKPLNLTKNNA